MKIVKVALDCDIPAALAPMLNASFGNRGFEFVHVSSIVPANSTDEFWAAAFRRFGGEITLSADKNIMKKPHKAAAFLENGFKAFFMQPPWSNAPGRVKFAHLTYCWQDIALKAADCEGGVCWQVPFNYKNEVLTLSSAEFKQLKVPDHILDEVRKTVDAVG